MFFPVDEDKVKRIISKLPNRISYSALFQLCYRISSLILFSQSSCLFSTTPSNLPTLGKIPEKPAFSRFKQYFGINGLSESFQSAYKSHHSTEAALVKVKNDVCSELKNGKMIMPILLDLVSAFDTFNHGCRRNVGLRVI